MAEKQPEPAGHILRLPLIDSHGIQVKDGYVLVRVSPSSPSAAASRPLDVKIVGTDLENAYAITLKQNRVSDLRANSRHCSDSEWSTILTHKLLQRDPDPSDETTVKTLDGIELSARIDTKKSPETLDIFIDRKLSEVQQRLGSIPLPLSPSASDTIDLTWAYESTLYASTLHTSLLSFRNTNLTLGTQISALEKQLADFIALKAASEHELLSKFCILLNEKKAKIRAQQRLLEGAKVDPKKLHDIRTKRRSTKSRTPEPSRRGKRKAEPEPEPEPEKDNDGDEEEWEELGRNGASGGAGNDETEDEEEKLDDEENAEIQTDHEDEDDDATASEDDGDGDAILEPTKAEKTRKTSPPKAKTAANAQPKPKSKPEAEKKEEKRDLPNVRTRKRVPTDDEETQSDDEL